MEGDFHLHYAPDFPTLYFTNILKTLLHICQSIPTPPPNAYLSPFGSAFKFSRLLYFAHCCGPPISVCLPRDLGFGVVYPYTSRLSFLCFVSSSIHGFVLPVLLEVLVSNLPARLEHFGKGSLWPSHTRHVPLDQEPYTPSLTPQCTLNSADSLRRGACEGCNEHSYSICRVLYGI